ncbi:N-acetylmuramate alpha-1-phosphate uridylyltransferase MurU [Methylogaea oryzae]|uniref:Mannose-1-phosphate guanylyltransferase n=1 Tax=Methylogaea oryzae TaxID=1295382 RepID=A0A8D4VPY2_9GAMM|nr:nucleotidyltransferase family protein [Methylogaea oryzae]BBL71900.1 mannose-1-phosphate guanylyltransferase [Methylogaea oryzae]
MNAMILAAGRGERLRPLTDHTPKPLLQAAGKPLIGHLLESLAAAGFRRIVVNLGHLGEQLRAALGDGDRYGVALQYSQEPDGALETGGGIRQALPLLGDKPFLVVNGDIATDFPFASLRGRPAGLAHLVLIPNPPHKAHGDFALADGLLRPDAGDGHTFAGIGVYRPELFAGLEPGRYPLAPLLRQAMAQGQVSGELYRGYWLDVGTPQRLQAADEHYRCAEHET